MILDRDLQVSYGPAHLDDLAHNHRILRVGKIECSRVVTRCHPYVN